MKSLFGTMLLATLAVLTIPPAAVAQESGPPQGSDPTLEEWEVPWEESRPRDPYVAPDGQCLADSHLIGVNDVTGA